MVGYISLESRGQSLAEDTNLGVKQKEGIKVMRLDQIT